ncbi:MAG: TatD family hydrolase [Ferroplasma sp.]
MISNYPIFDNFMHIRRKGTFLEAARKFKKSGGTVLNHVNFPDYDYTPKTHYIELYEETEKISQAISSIGINTVTTIGPYPLDYFYFAEAGLDPVECMKSGIEIAVNHIINGKADALGEIGFPHFPVNPAVQAHSEAILIYAMEKCCDHDIPLIIHTEDMSGQRYKYIEKLAQKYYRSDRIMKHHANSTDLQYGDSILKSLVATRDNVRKAIASKNDFLLETDYTDQIDKPGKVIPPESVPRRAEMIRNQYPCYDEIFQKIFSEIPYRFYKKDFFMGK